IVDRVDKAGTVDQVNAVVANLSAAVSRLDRAGTLDDLGAAARSARRIAGQIETGRGLLHALVYDEPETLRRLNALLGSAQETLARARQDSAVAVLLSPESGKAARSLLAAMDALGKGAQKPGAGEGLLSLLLFDPQYRGVADDLRTV